MPAVSEACVVSSICGLVSDMRPSLRYSALLVMVCVLTIISPARGSDWRAHGPYDVYVTNEGSGDLSVIDGSTWKVVATWKLGTRPRGVAVAKDGRRLFVAFNGTGADGIGVLDAASGRLINVIRGVSNPEQVALDSSGEWLNVDSTDAGSRIAIRIRDDRDIGRVPRAERPRNVALSPDGKFAYVPRETDSSLTLINTTTNSIIKKVWVRGENARPVGVIVRPDGGRVYVMTSLGGRIVAFDGHTLKLLGSAPVGPRPRGMALSPGGRYLYAANGPSNDVSVVDTTDMTIVATIQVGIRPWGVATSTRLETGEDGRTE